MIDFVLAIAGDEISPLHKSHLILQIRTTGDKDSAVFHRFKTFLGPLVN
jgi:hypothetical protein